jgi:hypothetical protein
LICGLGVIETIQVYINVHKIPGSDVILRVSTEGFEGFGDGLLILARRLD